jgi:hypothetical protein
VCVCVYILLLLLLLIYLFYDALSVSRVHRQTVGQLVGNELEGMLCEAVV